MREVEGNLLSIAERGEALGHGCNCEGVMGGLAAKVEDRWPSMAAEYRATCDEGTFTLGRVLPWLDEETGVWIYNLATQQQPGPDARTRCDRRLGPGRNRPSRANTGVRTIYLPRIGSGIGGLDWDRRARHTRDAGPGRRRGRTRRRARRGVATRLVEGREDDQERDDRDHEDDAHDPRPGPAEVALANVVLLLLVLGRPDLCEVAVVALLARPARARSHPPT